MISIAATSTGAFPRLLDLCSTSPLNGRDRAHHQGMGWQQLLPFTQTLHLGLRYLRTFDDQCQNHQHVQTDSKRYSGLCSTAAQQHGFHRLFRRCPDRTTAPTGGPMVMPDRARAVKSSVGGYHVFRRRRGICDHGDGLSTKKGFCCCARRFPFIEVLTGLTFQQRLELQRSQPLAPAGRSTRMTSPGGG